MCFDPYILQRITATRLDELRAEAARKAMLASVGRGEAGRWVTLRATLRRVAGRRGTIRPRPA